MKSFTTLLSIAYGASVAIAAACNADNCARAVTGTRRGIIAQSSAKEDCSSFLKATVYPSNVTSTVFVTVFPGTFISKSFVTTTTTTQTVLAGTSTIVAATEKDTETAKTMTVNQKRAVVTSFTTEPASPTLVPIYASACSGAVRYSSACSCFGVTPTTVTMVTPTFTKTVTISATLSTTIVSSVVLTSTFIQTVTESITTTTSSQVTATTTAAPVAGSAYCTNGNPVNGLSPTCQIGPCSTFNLRIEGASETTYEGIIYTGPKEITTSSGGTHLCNGVPPNSSPAGTGITCLADAGGLCNFDFDATYSSTFSDFFITRIGSTMQTDTQFWGMLNNFAITPTGGCQTQPQPGDELLWAFDAFNADSFLDIQPRNATLSVGSTTTFAVRASDGSGNFSPAAGALFNGLPSDANGQVVYVPTQPGVYRLKATRNGSIRSPAVVITVIS
ncbi:hypothetical protein VTL71DRAFT_3386 [Oculimacula yallundae]|uniref:Uncharacterized protein n=1 Tax=Oculimacula yallundae TaxID=86028 RepID=A0ABR4C8W4_9HELO